MSILSALYTLIISPLELLFEVIFTIANRLIGNEGLSIIFLSLAVNFLVLPLYKRADELQAEERDIQAKMAYRIKRTKETFKGDERFMMLQEYYKINHYKPIYALRSTFSLLLQIPFFIAAYNLLSGMQSLQGMPFGFISDLGKEDAMFMIGSFPVNILPILMTLINVVSGIIYTKGHPLKEKIQVYGLAAVFLVLLYRSPSGLVFYWLLNNVFSLVKNVFYKLKDPKKALSIVLAIAGLVLLIPTLIRTDIDARQRFLLASGCILLALPLLTGLIKNKLKNRPQKDKPAKSKDPVTFFTGAFMMALITGLLIPATVIDASAQEFIDVMEPIDPVLFIVNALLLAVGSFVLWGGVFYFFMSDKIKSVFSVGVWMLCGVFLIDYMLFGTNLGTLSSTLQYEITPSFKLTDYLLNILAVVVCAGFLYLVYAKLQNIARIILVVGIITVMFFGTWDAVIIQKTYNWFTEYNTPSTEMPSIPLSRNGKNVIVLMLDRAMGPFVPYLLNEKPELEEQFDGFTYYPNTISYGTRTIFATPVLYGGYEYTPERMNARSTEKLSSKNDEALKVMPDIFGNNGYEVTICDPPYAGYGWIPDLSIYDDYPDFHCYITRARFNFFEDNDESSTSVKTAERLKEIRYRNFFCFSLMKVAPLVIQETLYDNGLYNEANTAADNVNTNLSATSLVHYIDPDLTKSTGYELVFLESYTVLQKLPDITVVSDSSENTFLMMCNDTTHSPCLLQEPDYVPALNVDNTAYDVNMAERYTVDGVTLPMYDVQQVIHYHANMATYLKLGEWFDYLREQGVYDNTRIILVGDHGKGLAQYDLYCNGVDMEYYLPLLMVKDFDAHGFTVSDEFMTIGDTPVLATNGLIDNPINPFTRNPINSDLKNGPQTVFYCDIYSPDENTGNAYHEGMWFSFEGDPYKSDSWTYLGTH